VTTPPATALRLVDPAPASLHADLVGQLRDHIVAGELAPGARVPERDLCERFKVSRTPLREALKVLAAEGLIELLPHRGARVRAFSESDIRNLFEVLAGLDFVAGRLACERIGEAEVAEIERMHLQMYTHYLRRELDDYFRLNQAIHQSIVAAAANPVLTADYARLNAMVRQLRYTANLGDGERLSDAMREHEGIIDALRRRAGAELGLLMHDHMQRKCEAICAYLAESQGGETDRAAAPAF
jgi:DNA-binding GntR family transcriptional regulator